MTWRVELLTSDTVPDFEMLAKELHDQSGLEHLAWDKDKAHKAGIECVRNPLWFCQLAYAPKPIGFMAGYVTTAFFSQHVIGSEEGIYVRDGTPDRAAIAADMLRRFVRFCRDSGAADVRASVISGIDNYAADVFYRRNGFKRIGMAYSLKGDV